jgi:hypothetical protein
MEHKGIHYTVVQSIDPKGWRWTVDLAPPLRSRTGVTLQRADAVRRVLAVINNLVLPPTAQPEDGGMI